MAVSSCFWDTKVDIGTPAEFQVSLSSEDTVDISELRFSSLRLSFSDGRDISIQAGQGSESEDLVDLGLVDDQDKLRETPAIVFTPGKRITLRGRLVTTQESHVEVSA